MIFLKLIKIFLPVCILFFYATSEAQVPDQKKSIDITSTFKPVLREASKINFNAAPPQVDTSAPRLTYSIPYNNLFFTYQPAELKPVSLQADSVNIWQYSNFIKVGLGNVHLPYVEAGFSFGNGQNTYYNLFAKHFSSKGSLPFQKNALTSVAAAASYRTPKNLEWTASAGFSSDDYYLYGFKPDTLEFTKDDLKQRFQTIEAKLSLRNVLVTQYGISYQPNLYVSVFSDNHARKGSEANTVLTLPMQKTLGKSVGVNIIGTVDLTNYRLRSATKNMTVQNNLFMIAPAVVFKTSNIYIHGGLTPSWDQGLFHMLPNVMAEITTHDKRFTVQGGFIGYYNKGSYQRFASINPWLAQPDSLLRNTRVQEGYAGLKGTTGGHFSYSLKVGLQQHRNIPLFVNDTIDGKTFEIIYEPKLNIMQLHAEAEYRRGEQFSAKGIINWNQFGRPEQEKRAWGIIPFEINASVRWQVLKDLWFRTELWTWAGAPFRVKDLDNRRGQSAFDLNAGAEFRISRNFNLWVQMNNILNNKYERWNQYQVYGFNILGGVVYSFNQN